MVQRCIRSMMVEDISNVVDVHIKAFPCFFLTFLGPNFLYQLYSAIISDLSGIGFIAEDRGRMLGFVAGTSQPTGLYTRMLRQHWWGFGIASFDAFIKKPNILPRLLRAFTMPGQKNAIPICGTLMSIAVNPNAQGLGIGQMLVKAFLEEARQRGLQHVNLTTDRLNNDCTNRFYQRMGFSLYRCYTTPEGRQMNEYIMQLCPDVAPTPRTNVVQVEPLERMEAV